MKIAVIGGTGLIGSQVVKILNASGHEAVPHSPSTGLDLLSGHGAGIGSDLGGWLRRGCLWPLCSAEKLTVDAQERRQLPACQRFEHHHLGNRCELHRMQALIARLRATQRMWPTAPTRR
jgi:hypothetical protein